MIDSHCHLNSQEFINDVEKYIKEANEQGVHAFLVVGWDLDSSKIAVQLANKYNNIYAAVGIHPCDSLKMQKNDLIELEKLLTFPKVICLGEIGLDFYWNKDENDKEMQRNHFISQLQLANKYNLPVSIHSREANEETYKILKEYTPKAGGVMHCYSGGKDMLENYISLGMYCSFGGPVTFKNARVPKESALNCPLDKMLIETDSPYLAPQKVRGQMNKPEYVRFVLEEIANIKNINACDLDLITTKNFEELFHVKTYENED